VPLLEMEHYLVLSEDIEATRNFYRDVLGLRVGFRPNLEFGGYWLYLGDTPCIHIADRRSYAVYLTKLGLAITPAAAGTGPIDHIAFNCADFDATLSTIERLRIPYKRDTLTDIGLRQIFVHDPNGIKIELNFRASADSATDAAR
jgi:catechol 2,3-dioxygenase-like lactoylglutathione lyase family enzyme